jgi:hypothetical protein
MPVFNTQATHKYDSLRLYQMKFCLIVCLEAARGAYSNASCSEGTHSSRKIDRREIPVRLNWVADLLSLASLSFFTRLLSVSVGGLFPLTHAHVGEVLEANGPGVVSQDLQVCAGRHERDASDASCVGGMCMLYPGRVCAWPGTRLLATQPKYPTPISAKVKL